MQRRRRKKNPYFQRIGDVLQQALKKRQILLPTKDLRLWDAWTASVGPTIAAQTSLDRLKNDVLFVKVANSVWMQQLQFMKQDILEQLNGALGGVIVKNIFFTIGHFPPSPSGEGSDPVYSDEDVLTERDTRTIEQCASAVKDAELGEILKRVMTKDLMRRKKA